MRWLRRIGIALAIVLLLVAAALWWLLGTGSGLRFALHRVAAASDGAIAFSHAEGRLLGPLEVRGLRWRGADGMLVTIDDARLDLQPWSLLGKRLHLTSLAASGMTVALPGPPSEPPAQRPAPLSLAPPIDIVVDQASIRGLNVSQGTQPLLSAGTLDFGGRWTAKQLALRRLRLDAEQGHAQLDGKLALGGSWRGSGHGEFAWTIEGQRYAGNVDARGDGKRMAATLALASPARAQVNLQLAQAAPYPWTLTLDAPTFDPRPLLAIDRLHSLAVHLSGHGDRHGGTVQGHLDLNGVGVALQPLKAHLDAAGDTLTVDELKLSSKQIAGTVQASGRVELAARPMTAAFDLRWGGLQLPKRLVGQPLASRGHLSFSGSLQQFHAEGEGHAGPPGSPATMQLDLDGTPRQLTLHTLALQQPNGNVRAQGTLTLKPALGWQLTATASRFDPGRLLAGWDGALDFDLATRGTTTSAGLQGDLDIHTLKGTLRKRPVRGNGALHLATNGVVSGRLDLASGESSAHITAAPGAQNDIDLRLAIASLGDLMPQARGALAGHIKLRGRLSDLGAQGELNGHDIVWQQQQVARLTLRADLDSLSHPSGSLDLNAHGVLAGPLDLKKVTLRARGDEASHHLDLDLDAARGTLQLVLTGSLEGERWHGTISRFDLAPQGLPPWHLQHDATLEWQPQAFSLSSLCLQAGAPRLCLDARRTDAGALQASYQLHAVPLALLLTASGSTLPLRAEGRIDGEGSISRSAAGEFGGQAQLSSARGSFTWTDRPDTPVLAYEDFRATGDFGAGTQRLAVHARLNESGGIEGALEISGPRQMLDGQATLDLPDLAFLGLFTDEVANVRGRLHGALRFGGTLEQPRIAGSATIDGFAAEVPAAGLDLEQGHIELATEAGSSRWRIDGRIRSGKGELDIDGALAIGGPQPTVIRLHGQQFTAVNIPAAEVVVSPDLQIRRDTSGLAVTGSVAIDRADINVAKLPGGAGGVGAASPDIVVTDEPAPKPATAMPVTAEVKIEFGKHAHIKGMGIDGRLGGVLTVSEKPGRATLGQGQVAIDGTYHAYGQDLRIQHGQLLFASTPIDNPGLNIRAVRNLHPNATIESDQVVGLLISGTARRPVLTVFSNPAMEQSDALSYLVTGKPLSQVKGGEGNMVNAAAQALGSAAGDLLAKRIGARVGADIGVASNTALGGAAALTVGKYLSPRLYLSYGVGLFEPGEVVTLRYILSKRWNFEALNATDFSRMMFNYRLER
ncbi:MAG TPA: translocation/assembly module TamB domain-containing protein [Rhodanobacteraceae bacterium]|nr:translocation/assembly module TamB domain-containing protein [Rhodanobacteraceae bacterium]